MNFRYLCLVAYDGSSYNGFQRQLNAKTVQEEIEKAIKNMTRKFITIQSAGRTDKGVHALNQPFHFDLDFEIDIEILKLGLNKRLPDDIIINDIKIVSDDFHSRYSAKERVYQYKIAKKPSTIYTSRYEVYIENFDLEKAINATKEFIGIKDFSGFAKLSDDKDPIRQIRDITVIETNDHYLFNFYGISFLRYMIRSIMGCIIEIATNKSDISVIAEIFETKNRRLAGTTAKANGLFFVEVIY